MGSLVKSMILGVGIFLGILQPDRTPTLEGRLYRTGDQVFVSLEVVNGLNEDVENLILSGNTLQLSVEILLSGRKMTDAVHTISYDMKERMFSLQLGERGSGHRTRSKEAAGMLFLEFPDIPVTDAGGLAGRDNWTVTARAALEIPGDERFDAMVLWNYVHPADTWQFSRLTGIPW